MTQSFEALEPSIGPRQGEHNLYLAPEERSLIDEFSGALVVTDVALGVARQAVREFAGELTRNERRAIARITNGEEFDENLTRTTANLTFIRYHQNRQDGYVNHTRIARGSVGTFLPVGFERSVPRAAGLRTPLIAYACVVSEQVEKCLELANSLTVKQPADQPSDLYRLIRRLTFSANQPHDDRAAMFNMMLYIAEESDVDNTALNRAISSLEAGDLNKFIEAEILGGMLGHRLEHAPTELFNTHALVQLVRSCSDLTDVELISRLVSGHGLFPASVRAELSRALTSYNERVVASLGAVAHRLAEQTLCMTYAKEYIDSRSVFVKSGSGTLPGIKLRPVKETPIIETKRRRLLRAVEEEAVEVGKPTTPESFKRPKLVFNYGSTEPFDPSNRDQVLALFGKSLDNLVNDASFVQDICDSLVHLANVDFSGRVVGGVNKYGAPLKFHGESFEVHGFKPDDAAGLSLTTKNGRKLRILFVWEQEKVEIVAILERDKVSQFLKTHGMGSSRTTGQK